MKKDICIIFLIRGIIGNRFFYSRENYLFFLNKIKQHILPHADILAWCLMPNHFHLMIYVHTVKIPVSGPTDGLDTIGSTTLSRTTNRVRDLNKSIGILLTSYTRAINIQEKRSGSLFRPHTKAECITRSEGVTPSFYNTSFGAQINVRIPEKEYPQACFNYIHMNPVKAGLVDSPEDWEYSSFSDYSGKRSGKLINKQRADEFISSDVIDVTTLNITGSTT